MWVLLLSACQSCFSLPNTSENENRQDTSPHDSAADTADSASDDTGPPPMCEVELLESDGVDDHAEDYKTDIPVPMEAWVCGYFQAKTDFERLVFDVPDGAWLELEFEGAARGSSADGIMTAYATAAETDQCTQYARPDSSDPRVVFPVAQGGQWLALLAEDEQSYGEAFPWWFRASVVKSPVSPTVTDDELSVAQAADGHDGVAIETAWDYTEGMVVLGQLAPDDVDWYRIVIPEGMNQIHWNTDAAIFGSHADTNVYLYEEDPYGGLHLGKFDELDTARTGTDSELDSTEVPEMGCELGNLYDDDGNRILDEAGEPARTVAVRFGVKHVGVDCDAQFNWYTIDAYAYNEAPPDNCTETK